MNVDSTEILDTVIIGGGQAGLALGRELARQGREFVILDAARRVGDAWRLRWDSLQLFTPAKFNGLPGMRFPGDPLSFPGKDDVASYLEAYASRFALPVRTGVRVDRVRREGERFVASAGERRWESRNVVVATGGCQAPKVPGFADQLADHIVQLHSSDYRNPSQLPPGPVLVVGMGNSGAEIARDVAATHPTSIAGTPSGELPVRPTRATARFVLPVFRFAGTHVLTRGNRLGRAAAAGFRGAPLVRTKVTDLVDAGVERVPRVTGVRAGRAVLADDTTLEVSSVIWCTGYRDDFAWIELPAFDEHGEPRHRRGVVDSVPGLYFLGLEFLYAFTSATIPGVGRDARYLARRMPPASPAMQSANVGRAARGGRAARPDPERVP